MTAAMPLSGIRVADFSWYGAGPIAGRTLAAFGAEVIKVESEAHIDGLRRTQPTPPNATGYNVSGYYNNYNASKLSFTLNLGQPKAREVALRLIGRSDVMLENYTPRVAEQWGLTYEEVAQVRPDIVYARMPMQGISGPHRDFLGFGAVIGPVAGFSYLTGWPDRDPVGLAPVNYPDYVINPGHAAYAIMAALHYRNRTGKGQQIELAQLESTAATLGQEFLEYTVNGRVPTRRANRSEIAAPHGIFRAAGRLSAVENEPPEQRLGAGSRDPRGPLQRSEGTRQTSQSPEINRRELSRTARQGLGAGARGMGQSPIRPSETFNERWVAIAVYTDRQWRGLLVAMNEPEWATAERFQTFLGRKQHEDELERLLEGWTSTRPAEQTMALLQAHGVPAGIVQTAQDMLDNDPHIRERGYYQYLDHPETGRSAYDGTPPRLSETPATFPRAAPLLGEHNEYVLRDVLGYNDDEIAELLAEQVVF